MYNGFFSRFMKERNGTDGLNVFIAVILLCLSIVSFNVKNNILYGVQLVILVYFLFRLLSKDIYRRRRENERYSKLFAPVLKFSRRKVHQFQDKENRYFSCPKCSAKLRVPRNKGEITITCPVCKHQFDKRT